MQAINVRVGGQRLRSSRVYKSLICYFIMLVGRTLFECYEPNTIGLAMWGQQAGVVRLEAIMSHLSPSDTIMKQAASDASAALNKQINNIGVISLSATSAEQACLFVLLCACCSLVLHCYGCSTVAAVDASVLFRDSDLTTSLPWPLSGTPLRALLQQVTCRLSFFSRMWLLYSGSSRC